MSSSPPDDNVVSPAYAYAMTTADREAALRRVRYAADAAFAEGLSETEILAAVRAGIANAEAVAALFADHIDEDDLQAA